MGATRYCGKQLYIYTEAIPLEFRISCFTLDTYLKLLIGRSYSMNNIFLTGEAFIFKAPQRKVSIVDFISGFLQEDRRWM